MKNQFENKMVDNGTTPKFDTGMFFCVHTNTSPVTLEDCSQNKLSEELPAKASKEELVGVNSLKGYCEYEDRLIQRQDEIIKALEKRISDVEELLERDNEMVQLENELEEICEKLFLEVNFR